MFAFEYIVDYFPAVNSGIETWVQTSVGEGRKGLSSAMQGESQELPSAYW